MLVDSLATLVHREDNVRLKGDATSPQPLPVSGEHKRLSGRRFGLTATVSGSGSPLRDTRFGFVVAADERGFGLTIAYQNRQLQVGEDAAELKVPNDRLTLQIYVDGYIVEVFVRQTLDLPTAPKPVEVGTQVWSAQLPLKQGSDGIAVFTAEGVELSYRFFEMQSIYMADALPATGQAAAATD